MDAAVRRFKVSLATVKKSCEEFGVEIGIGNKARAARRLAMAQAVNGGLPVEQVCENFGASLSTVRNACRENGVTPRKNEAPKSITILAELLKGELPQADIARKLGVSKQMVSWTAGKAERAGIEFRKFDMRGINLTRRKGGE